MELPAGRSGVTHGGGNVEALLYAGTEDGVVVLRWDGGTGLRMVGRGLAGQAVRAIAVDPRDPARATVGCGLRGWGLHRTADAGGSFEALGFADRWVWEVAHPPGDPEALWVGTEPPMLYVSRDGGATFRPLEGLERLPSRARWTFFHPPFYAGHVHGLAFHPRRPGWVFAGVEHGALIYSRDGGATWQEALVGYDLHRTAVDPEDPDRVLAGAGEGLFASRDAGASWEPVPALAGRYVHGIVFCTERPGRVLVYAADPACPVYRSDDGGGAWKAVGAGLPPSGPADPLAVHPCDPERVCYAGDVDRRTSRLFVSTDGGRSWAIAGPELPKVWRLKAARPQAMENDGTGTSDVSG